MPDFTFYDKHGYYEGVAIREIRYVEGDTEIAGIWKGENYPIRVTVKLSEINCYSRLNLADYLLSEKGKIE